MIAIKKLESTESIEDACALLYKVYFEQASWNFSLDNPSKMKVEIKNNKKILLDRFTNRAIWFGAFDNSRLIGCARLTLPDENNKLEMESYESSSVIQKYLPADKSQCVELTRVAVLQSHSGHGIVPRLFLAALQYCEAHQHSICITSNDEYIIRLLKEIDWPLKMERAFKYENQEHTPVNFNFADHAKSEVKNMILNLQITAEKEVVRLQIAKEKQKILLEQEAKFTKIANQVAHDIRSPLASLLMIIKSCTQIPEADRIALKEAIIGIGDIASHLLHQYQKKENVEREAGIQKVEAVIIDDDKVFVNSLLLFAFDDDDIVEEYYNPEHFLKSADKYPKDTKIYLDNNYATSDLKGLDVAKILHERGYTQLYLLSGEALKNSEIPSYLTVIGKNDIDRLRNL